MEQCFLRHSSEKDSSALLELAARFKLSFETPGQDPGLRLFFEDGRLCLGDLREGRPGPIAVDFLQSSIRRRLRQASPNKEDLARAAGLRKGYRPWVIDATAGLGQDAAVLATLGCRILLVERSPVVASLLEDGLRRASKDPSLSKMAARIKLLHAESHAYLAGLSFEARPPVIYLDPMYAPSRSTALPGGSMQHLQTLLGHTDETEKLLSIAIEVAKERVVLKRSRHAPYLNRPAPNHSIVGRSTRFDIYLSKG